MATKWQPRLLNSKLAGIKMADFSKLPMRKVANIESGRHRKWSISKNVWLAIVLKWVPWESFFSWNDLRYFYISECLRAFVKSLKIILESGKSLKDLLTWRLFPSENEKWRADSLKSLVQRNVQMTGALTEGVSTLLWI